jgi:hypothetical protein
MREKNTPIAALLLILTAGGIFALNSISTLTTEMRVIFTLVAFVFMLVIFVMLVK